MGKKPRWSARTLRRYALFQIPDICLLILILIVAKWLDLPGWLTYGFIIFWIAKDIVMFPFVWRAYDTGPPSMIGNTGVAEERLAPFGYIRIQGELWKAELAEGFREIEKGEPVRVRAIKGLTLIVEPDGRENGA